MFFYLALRNIIRNIKENSIVVILIAVITFFFYIGNTSISNIDRNIRLAYIESLTGDVVIQKTGDITLNLFGANSPIIGDFFSIPVLPAYDAIMEIIAKENNIMGITSQVSGNAYLDLLDVREPVLLCGIDDATYFDLFSGIVLTEGRFLQDGEYGAMITSQRALNIQMRTGQSIEIGMPLLFTTGSSLGFKIREVPLVGIFSYENPGQFMNEIVIIDSQTVRVLNSIQVAATTIDAQDSSSGIIASFSDDDLFGDGFFLGNEITDTGFSPEFLQNYLSEASTVTGDETGGAWNFILLRLNKGVSSSAFISSLNEKINPFGVTAVNWRIASGTSSILMLLLQALFNFGILLISVIGIMAVLNILLISVFRRVREIGTLRAIGASDSYIRTLIYCENLLLAFIAGVIGVLFGVLFIQWINDHNIFINNNLIVSLLNSPYLHFNILPFMSFLSMGIALLLGILATIFPVETAVRIEPVVAVRQG